MPDRVFNHAATARPKVFLAFLTAILQEVSAPAKTSQVGLNWTRIGLTGVGYVCFVLFLK